MSNLNTPFEPCVVVFDDPKRTEMVLRDVATVWVSVGDCELGYDMESGELVAVRIYGDASKIDRGCPAMRAPQQ